MPKKIYILIVPILLAVLAVIYYKKEILILLNSKGYDASKQTAIFHGTTVKVPAKISETALSYATDQDESNSTSPDVLGSKAKRKRIEVDLTNQKLYAYEGDDKKMSFDVSTGKWALTPTGEFRIWTKIKYSTMSGGSKALGTYYYLPNVPFTMYFYKDYGIHGAYWHDNFGHPMSHGCVNMRPAEAEKLFYWASPSISEDANSVLATDDNKGTPVIVYGTTPEE